MERRHIAFLVASAAILLAWSYFFVPPQRPRPNKIAKKDGPPTAVKDQPVAKDAPPAEKKAEDKKVVAEKPQKAVIEPAKAAPPRDDLFLGKKDDSEFKIYARLSNQAASVQELWLNDFKDEKRTATLQLLEPPLPITASFALTVGKREEAAALLKRRWEVVESSPERIVFRTSALSGQVQIEKRFSLEKDSYVIKLEVAVKNLTDGEINDMTYDLTSASSINVEGKWYTTYFRKLCGVQLNNNYPSLIEQDVRQIVTNSTKKLDQTVYSQSPIQFAGVESQYFTSLVIQEPLAFQDRLISSIQAVDLHEQFRLKLDEIFADKPPAELTRQKIELSKIKPEHHDIAFSITSTPISLKKAEEKTHTYLLYNGPKKESELAKFDQFHLPLVIHYQDFLFIPVGTIAKVMVGILNFIYGVVGDYGIGIILLTLLVRACMLPVSFRQAKVMQRMQVLAPKMEEIKQKYADDKEKLNRAVMDLYAKENVNPLGGCLPLLLQLPIFVGLYQSLYQSFSLRHSSFLWGLTWIKDLAAPDQMFPFGMDVYLLPEIPFLFGSIGPLHLGPFFNLLPTLAVIQMVAQAIYMSPPATNPEAEMQKRMMTGMMVVMGLMFYKVPAGLCVYIITSSLWAMLERQFLPKAPKAAPKASGELKTSDESSSITSNGTSWRTPISKKGKAKR